ncbi:MAG TPA: hypothetical protein GXZ59_01925, partial [Clostridiaceae bacterium]|nr:hypothetical protein [Clostridiaceae bacterium]
TTAKVSFSQSGQIVFERYDRHLSHVSQKTLEILEAARDLLSEAPFTVAISGSAGLGMAEASGLTFVQEVYSTAEIIKQLAPDTGAVVELGGEDAKVIFFEGGADARMNGSCAGGTGAFIDQMAALLDMTIQELDEASLRAERIYPIASRCGVFAKTDVQALFNQGASKDDVAASVYQAVVNQTIVGLMQGRQLEGKVLFLGGPLYYCKGLRYRFRETLDLSQENSICPDYALFAVARGAAYFSRDSKPMTYDELIASLQKTDNASTYERGSLPPLFNEREDYKTFRERHDQYTVPEQAIEDYTGKAWLGIDSGSTTTKLALISENKRMLYSYYCPNLGAPLDIVFEQIKKIRALCGDRIEIAGCATTGYGEALIQHAFKANAGLVETIAHYTAAQHFQPEVDFILDIGGQDIKCFYIKNGAIDSIKLNEACSSGCGSFLETYAHSMDYEVEDFALLGIDATAPTDLGSRCTVFMNSSIKQAQRDGAKIEDISAGLSISVVKNALYKVIRVSSPEELGKHIVVQGGTLLNDAVLRALELELEREVVRPTISGLMGAFGAALYAMQYDKSDLLTAEQLEDFTHKSTTTVCRACTNHCHLTINSFAEGDRFVSGNQCQRGLGLEESYVLPNLYHWKRERLQELHKSHLLADCQDSGNRKVNRGKIGIPTTLSSYELAPLWKTLFTELGYEVVFSPLSSRRTYELGQLSIPSDTICYPAKIMHGHIEQLVEQGLELIFYPSLTYNLKEADTANNYNCPIVAYYGEVLQGNMSSLEKVKFIYPYLDIDSERALFKTLYRALHDLDPTIRRTEVKRAVTAGFKALEDEREAIEKAGLEAVEFARQNGKRILIMAGRPYHIDPEICHGIDRIATSLGFVVVTEDSVCNLADAPEVKILNQWTYHSRLYKAAQFACDNDDVELVQLVSFSCGIDAITTDEVRRIMESQGKLYTEIKIDDISNLGALRIRLRSLLGAVEARDSSLLEADRAMDGSLLVAAPEGNQTLFATAAPEDDETVIAAESTNEETQLVTESAEDDESLFAATVKGEKNQFITEPADCDTPQCAEVTEAKVNPVESTAKLQCKQVYKQVDSASKAKKASKNSGTQKSGKDSQYDLSTSKARKAPKISGTIKDGSSTKPAGMLNDRDAS